MEQFKFEDMELLEFGHTIQIGGVIFAGNGKNHICLLPDDADLGDEFCVLDLNTEDWKKVLRQTDLMEIQVLQKATDGKLAKALLRKTTRVIEQGLSWRVFKRDGYKCRYCGKEGIPMTVDHLVLWEDGGPSIEENLLTSCRKCNKRRGSIQYADWLNNHYYLSVSKNLTDDERDLNEAVVFDLDKIPLRIQDRSR